MYYEPSLLALKLKSYEALGGEFLWDKVQGLGGPMVCVQ